MQMYIYKHRHPLQYVFFFYSSIAGVIKKNETKLRFLILNGHKIYCRNSNKSNITHTHTHTYIYIYIYIKENISTNLFERKTFFYQYVKKKKN